MRLGILIALWQRPKLTRLVLGYWTQLQVPGVELVRVAVASPEDPKRVQRAKGFTVLQAPNEPLSDKWNAGLAYFEDQGVDAILIAGSDDLFCVGYVQNVCDLVQSGIDWVRLGSMYFLDLPTRRMVHMWHLNAGAGRVFSSRLLERLGWQAWRMGRSVW